MEKDKSILAIGDRGRWVVYWPGAVFGSLAGFLFWSSIIAAGKQLWVLMP